MTVRLTTLGGSDWSDGEVLDAADLNDTINASLNGGLLGEVKMFALSITGAITKATLQGNGWAICDGTTPAAQGISSADITAATPDLQEKFIRMSDDETSGATGGAASDTHLHQWLNDGGGGATGKIDTLGSGDGRTYNASGGNLNLSVTDWDTNSYTTNTVVPTLPPFYELVFFIKVKYTA